MQKKQKNKKNKNRHVYLFIRYAPSESAKHPMQHSRAARPLFNNKAYNGSALCRHAAMIWTISVRAAPNMAVAVVETDWL